MNYLRGFTALLLALVLVFEAAPSHPTATAAAAVTATPTSDNQLVLKKNSKEMIFNGKKTLAAQPMTIRNGFSYAPLNGIVQPFGYKLSYDVATKESVASNGSVELRFKAGSSQIKMNDAVVEGPGPAFLLKGSLMIPLRTWSTLTGSRISLSGSDTVFNWKSAPSAKFTVQPAVIYAGKTAVTYMVDGVPSVLPTGENESWEGRQDMFLEPGPHEVTRRLMDENGNWGEPFTVTINVLTPSAPPIADFSTDKPVYKIGEQVLLTDLSTDDLNQIKSVKWSGEVPWGYKPGLAPLAFFEAGEHQIILNVEDAEGQIGTVSKTVSVSSEVLYNQEQFNLLFTPVGHRYVMNGQDVLNYSVIPYTAEREQAQLVLSDDPERWTTTGLAYRTELTGNTRFLFYNENGIGANVKFYLIATNAGATPAQIGIGAWGSGGPDASTFNTGKVAAVRYLESLNKLIAPPSMQTLAPGESTILLPQLSAIPVKPNQVYTGYVDVVTDMKFTYRLVVLPSEVDPKTILGALDTIVPMQRDYKHVRATFYDANHSIVVNEELGAANSRIILADNKNDLFLEGKDEMTGEVQYNSGNYGVLYRMKLNVAPNTLIGLNARGGHYTGAFLVNGELVPITGETAGGALTNSNEVAVLHRTGNQAETVDIVFTIASGSNTPISLLFRPIPQPATQPLF